MNKYNRKNAETEERIKRAAIRIYENSRDNSFSVTNICTLAGINRCTFYLHYSCVEELMENLKSELLDGMEAHSRGLRLYNIYDVQHHRSSREEKALVGVMCYCAEKRDYMIPLLSPEGDPGFREDLRQMIAGLFIASFYLYNQTYGSEQAYAIRFITSGLVDILYNWLICQDKSPEEMSAFCMRMSELVPVIQK